MLLLLNTYGLSHVCGNDEFQNLEDSSLIGYGEGYFYPYLDILFENKGYTRMLGEYASNYVRKHSMKFLFRGYNEDDRIEFRNLFQYLVFAKSHGFQGNLLFCFAKIFGIPEEYIYEDFMLLKDLLRTNKPFVNRTELHNSRGRKIFGK